jgi:hypothetical protein
MSELTPEPDTTGGENQKKKLQLPLKVPSYFPINLSFSFSDPVTLLSYFKSIIVFNLTMCVKNHCEIILD